MLELIFQGFAEWLYGLILECWEHFSSSLLDIMSMDFAYLQEQIPILSVIRQILLAAGWALLLGNLVFQAARTMMTGIGFEGEDPKLLFTRTFVFSFLLLASPQICQICLDLTSTVMELLDTPDVAEISLLSESAFDGLDAAWLLVILCGIIVIVQSFKLILELAERYLILAMLTICAPLAFGVGGSRSTADIFQCWCRMYGSMCFLMVSHVIFLNLLLSVLAAAPSGLSVLPWMVLILSIVKVAKKSDAIITRIGLNPAITSDSLGRGLPGALTYMVLRNVSSHVTKAAASSVAGQGPGRSGGTAPGGRPVPPPGTTAPAAAVPDLSSTAIPLPVKPSRRYVPPRPSSPVKPFSPAHRPMRQLRSRPAIVPRPIPKRMRPPHNKAIRVCAPMHKPQVSLKPAMPKQIVPPRQPEVGSLPPSKPRPAETVPYRPASAVLPVMCRLPILLVRQERRHPSCSRGMWFPTDRWYSRPMAVPQLRRPLPLLRPVILSALPPQGIPGRPGPVDTRPPTLLLIGNRSAA